MTDKISDEILEMDLGDVPLMVRGKVRDVHDHDKQFVLDYLTTLDWDKTFSAPALPGDIVQRTLSKYSEARDRLIE